MNKKILSIAAITIVGASAAFGAIEVEVFVSSDDGLYLQSNGVTPTNQTYTLDAGYIPGFDLNTFMNATPQEKQTMRNSAYNDFVSFAGPFNFEDILGNLTEDPAYLGTRPAAIGTQLYTLVQNALTGEVGIFTVENAFWEIGDDSGVTPKSSLFLQVGTPIAVIGSVDGINGVLAGAVPEPSTYAFIAGLLTLGLVAYRRRQRA